MGAGLVELGRCEVIFAAEESGDQAPTEVALRIFSHRALGEVQGWELTVQQLAGGRAREAEHELDRFRCLQSAEEQGGQRRRVRSFLAEGAR